MMKAITSLALVLFFICSILQATAVTETTTNQKEETPTSDITSKYSTPTSSSSSWPNWPPVMLNPWRELWSIKRQLGLLDEFDSHFFSDPFMLNRRRRTTTTTPSTSEALSKSSGGGSSSSSMIIEKEAEWMPAVDVHETDSGLVVHAELPGVTVEDIDVQVDDGVLTVSGKREQQREEKGQTWHRRERSFGYFERSVRLPKNADAQHIQATYNHGVLEVTVPKLQLADAKSAHKIEVVSRQPSAAAAAKENTYIQG